MSNEYVISSAKVKPEWLSVFNISCLLFDI